MKKRILPTILFALAYTFPLAHAGGETETITTTWSNKILSNKYIEWNLGDEWSSGLLVDTPSYGGSAQTMFSAGRGSFESTSIGLYISYTEIPPDVNIFDDTYLRNLSEHQAQITLPQGSDIFELVVDEPFITAGNHQAVVVHLKQKLITDTPADLYLFVIDGSTTGIPQPEGTWLKVIVRLTYTSLSSGELTIEEAKSIVNGLKFKGGPPKPFMELPEFADMSPGSSTTNSTDTTGKPTSAPAAVTATITAATSSSSQGSVAGGGTFTAGATASLTATATAGYIFSHWSGGYSGTENPLSLTVSADATVTANFAQDGRDSDNDGLSNYDEIQRGTDPNDSDTDDDFLTDGLEVDMALNPLVANGSLQEIATAAQAAMTNAREAGRQEVLNNPIAYGFVSGGAPATNATGNGETPMIEGWFYQEASGWQYVSAQTYTPTSTGPPQAAGYTSSPVPRTLPCFTTSPRNVGSRRLRTPIWLRSMRT